MLALIEQVSCGELCGSAARSKVWACDDLYTMSPVEAEEVVRRIYDIVAKENEASVRVHASLLERGDLLSLLEDARALSPVSRRAKWDGEAAERETARNLQLESAERTMRVCTARTGLRKDNRDAWERIAARRPLRAASCQLLALTDQQLLLKPPLFWKALPLEDMSDDLMRASMGRIDILLSTHGRGRFPESLAKRYDEQMARLSAVAVTTVGGGEGSPRAAAEVVGTCGCLPLRCGRWHRERKKGELGEKRWGGRSARSVWSRSKLATRAVPNVGTSSTAHAHSAPSKTTRGAASAARRL